MSKKLLKQLGNIVAMQAVGYTVGEVFRHVGPRVKKAMGLETEESEPAPEEQKQERRKQAKKDRESNKEISDLVRETKKDMEKIKDVPAVEAKDPDEPEEEQ